MAERIQAEKDADGAQQRYDALEQEIEHLASLTRQLERQRSEHPKLAERGQLEDALGRFGEDYRRLRNQFREKAQGLNQLTNVLRALRSTPSRLRVNPLFAEGFRTLDQAIPLAIGLESEQLHEDVVHVLTGEAESGETGEALERIRGQLRESEAAITLIAEEIGGEGGLLSVVREQYFERAAKEKGLTERRLAVDAEIRELAEARRVSYPRSASEGLSLLREQLPDAKARILCDLVSVRPSEEEWQQPIEGYLGGNRFMLIVEQAFEVEANRMLRRHSAKVAQTLRVLQRAGQPLPADSIVECLSVEDAIAKAYLKAAYGDVVKVDDFETLRRTARGVMRDGRSAAGFATGRSWVEDGDLVFGESGRRRRLAARRKELADLDLELTQVGELRSELQGLMKSLEAVRSPNAEEAVSGMIRVRKDLTDARARLAMLDVGDGAEIEARYERTEKEYKEALNAKEQAATERAIANRAVEEKERWIEGLRSDQDSLIAGRKQAYAVLDWLDETSEDYVLLRPHRRPRRSGVRRSTTTMDKLLESQASGSLRHCRGAPGSLTRRRAGLQPGGRHVPASDVAERHAALLS